MCLPFPLGYDLQVLLVAHVCILFLYNLRFEDIKMGFIMTRGVVLS